MAHSTNTSDTTYTKIFVGGLAWETQRDTMRKHFEQYGEILEAVVITDRVTGRSKGYGFVTFKDPEAARRACMDPTPIIDGRRANCNLASLGQKQRQFYGQFGSQGGSPGYGGYGPASYAGYPQGYGYPPYGYPPQFPEGYGFHQGMYSPYGHPGFSPMPGMYGAPGSIAGSMYGGYSGFSPGSMQNVPGSPNFGSSQLYPQGPSSSQQMLGYGGQPGASSGGNTSGNPGSPINLQSQFNGQNQSQNNSSSSETM